MQWPKRILPVDRRGSSVPGQYGGMVADALVYWVRDHFHGDKLRAEWQHVDVCPYLRVILSL